MLKTVEWCVIRIVPIETIGNYVKYNVGGVQPVCTNIQLDIQLKRS